MARARAMQADALDDDIAEVLGEVRDGQADAYEREALESRMRQRMAEVTVAEGDEAKAFARVEAARAAWDRSQRLLMQTTRNS